jgi:LysM repeat protein
MKQVIALLIVFCSFSAFAHKTDSIGTKVKNGKAYILHKVEKGDGLYSISKRYGVNLKTLVNENPGADKVIKIDQLIWIPTSTKPVLEEKVVNDFFKNTGNVKDVEKPNDNNAKTEVSTFAKYHKVAPGQTLYGISKLYNTSVEMIKTLNNLSSDELSEGQRILVQDGKAKIVEVENKDVVETDYDKMKKEMEKNKYEDIGFESDVETTSNESSVGYTVKVEKLVEYNIEKVEETGTMSVGASNIPNDKNFALHFNAPKGTVIMVTNPENKSTVFVKVIGNFVKGEMSSEIIKLSSTSAEQIGVVDKDKIMLSYAR